MIQRRFSGKTLIEDACGYINGGGTDSVFMGDAQDRNEPLTISELQPVVQLLKHDKRPNFKRLRIGGDNHFAHMLGITPSFNSEWQIGDEGAMILGDVLRTNTTLVHLDLRGNHITDLGARSFLLVLEEANNTLEDILLEYNDVDIDLLDKIRILLAANKKGERTVTPPEIVRDDLEEEDRARSNRALGSSAKNDFELPTDKDQASEMVNPKYSIEEQPTYLFENPEDRIEIEKPKVFEFCRCQNSSLVSANPISKLFNDVAEKLTRNGGLEDLTTPRDMLNIRNATMLGKQTDVPHLESSIRNTFATLEFEMEQNSNKTESLKLELHAILQQRTATSEVWKKNDELIPNLKETAEMKDEILRISNQVALRDMLSKRNTQNALLSSRKRLENLESMRNLASKNQDLKLNIEQKVIYTESLKQDLESALKQSTEKCILLEKEKDELKLKFRETTAMNEEILYKVVKDISVLRDTLKERNDEITARTLEKQAIEVKHLESLRDSRTKNEALKLEIEQNTVNIRILKQTLDESHLANLKEITLKGEFKISQLEEINKERNTLRKKVKQLEKTDNRVSPKKERSCWNGFLDEFK